MSDLGAYRQGVSPPTIGNRYTPPSAGEPSWVAPLPLNTWTALPMTNDITDVDTTGLPNYSNFRGNSGVVSVFHTWNSAVLAPELGAHGRLLVYGGGHADYHGNEVYSLDLDTLTWSRVYGPSDFCNPGPVTDGIYPDGSPSCPHTFHGVAYDHVGHRFFTQRRQTTNAPNTTYEPAVFNSQTNTWFCSQESISPLNPAGVGGGAAFDSSRGLFWQYMPTGSTRGVASYDPDADNMTVYTFSTGGANGYQTIYIPSQDAIMYLEVALQAYAYVGNLNAPSSRTNITNFTGSWPAAGGGIFHDWNEDDGVFYVQPDKSGGRIYVLTPPAGDWLSGQWQWSELSLSGSVPTDSTAVENRGEYGKFRVLQYGARRVAILQSAWGFPVYGCRLN